MQSMSQTVRISEKSAVLLAQQAAAHGKSLEAWIEELAMEKAATSSAQKQAKSEAPERSLVEHMRALRSRVRPDPEGWTVKDYIDYGRH
jgi:hypothetical protein